MPAFKKELELLTQHKQIHVGIDKLEKYLDECERGERELRMQELKEILDSFGEVLWQHLDDEVKLVNVELYELVIYKLNLPRVVVDQLLFVCHKSCCIQ